MDEGAAGVDDVGHVAFAFVGGGSEERFFEAADDTRGVVAVEEDGTDAVFAHGADAVGQDEPTGFGFDGRTAIAHLDEFPGLRWTDDDFRFIPEVQVVGEHEVDVLAVLPAEHGVESVDFAGEEGEALAAHGGAVEGAGLEFAKVAGRDHLRENDAAVVSGVGGMVGDLAVVAGEADEARVFDAVALQRGKGEDDLFGEVESGFEAHGVVGLAELDSLFAGADHLVVGSLAAQAADAGHEVRHGEDFRQVGGGLARRILFGAHFEKFAADEFQVVLGGGFGARGVDKFRNGVEAHRAVGARHAGAESDGRDVSFPGGPQAEDEAHFVGAETGLVGRRDDAGIEESAGFERILVGEIRADEQAARLVEFAIDGQQRGQLAEAFEKNSADVFVPVVELGQDYIERGEDGGVVEHEDAGQHIEEAPTGFGMTGGLDHDGGHEGTQQHAAGVGAEFEGLAAEVHLGVSLELRWKAAVALSRAFISERASQKDKVDSAPWFWLARLAWRPSRQPPVEGS